MAQKEGELRLRGAIQPTEYGQTQVMNQPITEQPEVGQPITAALGAGRIAELKSQLHKNKVDPDTYMFYVLILRYIISLGRISIHYTL